MSCFFFMIAEWKFACIFIILFEMYFCFVFNLTNIFCSDEVENMILVFTNPEHRMQWQAAFLDAKDRLGRNYF